MQISSMQSNNQIDESFISETCKQLDLIIYKFGSPEIKNSSLRDSINSASDFDLTPLTVSLGIVTDTIVELSNKVSSLSEPGKLKQDYEKIAKILSNIANVPSEVSEFIKVGAPVHKYVIFMHIFVQNVNFLDFLKYTTPSSEIPSIPKCILSRLEEIKEKTYSLYLFILDILNLVLHNRIEMEKQRKQQLEKSCKV